MFAPKLLTEASWQSCLWTDNDACMRWSAAAASMAWALLPPTSSHAATQRAGAELLGAASVKWCNGSKTESGSRMGMTALRWQSILSLMESEESVATVTVVDADWRRKKYGRRRFRSRGTHGHGLELPLIRQRVFFISGFNERERA